MFISRDLATIESVITTFLAQSGIPADLSEGSIFTALIRSFAAGQVAEDQNLLNLTSGMFLQTAQGSTLDQRAADLDPSLVRKTGTYATGSVLAQSLKDGFVLNPGVVLTEPSSGLQVQVQGTGITGYSISSVAQTAVPVQALLPTELANFQAGTSLISPTFPQGSFVVGTHRTTAGAYCGDLTGGLQPESDALFRARILQFIQAKGSCSDQAIKAAILAQSSVEWAALRVPSPGVIEVWVDSESTLLSTELSSLLAIAANVKPAGVLISVYQATRTYTDVNIYCKPKNGVDLQALTDTLIAQIHTYLMTLGLGQPLTPALLQSYLQSLSSVSSNVISLSVLSPSAVVTPNSTGVVRTENAWITYDTV
jgi:hypothetical protein